MVTEYPETQTFLLATEGYQGVPQWNIVGMNGHYAPIKVWRRI